MEFVVNSWSIGCSHIYYSNIQPSDSMTSATKQCRRETIKLFSNIRNHCAYKSVLYDSLLWSKTMHAFINQILLLDVMVEWKKGLSDFFPQLKISFHLANFSSRGAKSDLLVTNLKSFAKHYSRDYTCPFDILFFIKLSYYFYSYIFLGQAFLLLLQYQIS